MQKPQELSRKPLLIPPPPLVLPPRPKQGAAITGAPMPLKHDHEEDEIPRAPRMLPDAGIPPSMSRAGRAGGCASRDETKGDKRELNIFVPAPDGGSGGRAIVVKYDVLLVRSFRQSWWLSRVGICTWARVWWKGKGGAGVRACVRACTGAHRPPVATPAPASRSRRKPPRFTNRPWGPGTSRGRPGYVSGQSAAVVHRSSCLDD